MKNVHKIADEKSIQ